MDKTTLPTPPISERSLGFVPVKNVGKRGFTLALDDGGLVLYSGEKKYRILLTEEEK